MTKNDMQQFQTQLDEAACWEAALTRSRDADGLFVFGVRTTGIYCRPSCPARRARREHVVFFREPEQAEQAGFRPCLRCHPQRMDDPLVPQKQLVERIRTYIADHLDASIRLDDLARVFHLSPSYIQRTFKRIQGVSPRQYAESCRLQQFKEHLQQGNTITDALYDAGYQSSSSVYGRTPAQLGMTPSAYRNGGKGMCIGYDIVETLLGYVLVAVTERGLVAVRFADSECALFDGLRQEYSAAKIQRDASGLQPWMVLLQRHLQGQALATAVDIPLDVQASAFQWKVWNALRTIPSGQTCSYQEIARRIGQPTAVRAVAHACATNPVAVFIPCHRVVRNNGQIGGYRWGSQRKERLLAAEQYHAGIASDTDAPVLQ
jgi:AraC family transcriptional regulator of adaptative response/methylated-DNA-[protein]-cysteine methyltransferase